MGKNVAPPVPRAASLLGSDAPGPVRAPWSSDSGPRLAPGCAFTRGSPDPAERCWPPNAPTPPQPLGRPAPPRRSLPRSPFRSPESPATFEEMYAGEPLPPLPSRPWCACMRAPLGGAPRGLACLDSGCPGPRSRPRDVSAPSLSPPASQEDLSLHFIKFILPRKFPYENVNLWNSANIHIYFGYLNKLFFLQIFSPSSPNLSLF